MNNFLLSGPTDRDIMSASNPRLGALFEGNRQRVSFGESWSSEDSSPAVSGAKDFVTDIHYQEQECVRPAR